MRHYFVSLMLLSSLICAIPKHALAQEENPSLVTRFGLVQAKTGVENRKEVFLDKKKIFEIEFDDMTVYKILSTADSEYLLFDGLVPSLHCHHEFYLLQVRKNGTALSSQKFGDCNEFFAARLDGQRLIIQMSESPFLSGEGVKPKPMLMDEFIWHEGKLSDGKKDMPWCPAVLRNAEAGAQVVNAESRTVIGKGRLYFHSAPDEICANEQLFVVTGDTLKVLKSYEKFSLASYQHPISKKITTGWVLSARLKSL